MGLMNRMKRVWNAFLNKDPTDIGSIAHVPPSTLIYGDRPDRFRLRHGTERSIINSIITRISMDVSSIDIRHCVLDNNGRYKEERKSDLNECLTISANKDQTSRAFIRDVVQRLLDEGVVAIVPVDTDVNPLYTDTYDIRSLRAARIIEWYPDAVRLDVYNDRNGRHQQVLMPKRCVAIIENPLYSIMNSPNSTQQRLVRKLNILDVIDEQSGSGKLDLIIQLPYPVKTELQRENANSRRKDIEEQLQDGKYGIAYTGATEKITQLNRSVDNNLMKQVEYLTSMLHSQLGISQAVLDGSASEQEMLNYNNRTVEPIISAITDELRRKFLTKTARSQGQSICYFRDPFKLVPVNNIAEIADKFTRNEIMTSNEIRQIIGMRPSDDPKADKLINSNISQPDNENDNSMDEYKEIIEEDNQE